MTDRSVHILAVDDEPLSLHALTEAIAKAMPGGEIHAFEDAPAALAFAGENPVDIAFLDISLGTANGIALAQRFKKADGALNIIFVTGYGDYARDAMEMHASGYIMKPVTEEKVRRELGDLRHPLRTGAPATGGGADVRIHTFGSFQLFIGGAPVTFRYRRTKELLALLTDRQGAFCSNSRLIELLWETEADATKSSYLRVLRQDLLQTLGRYGARGIILQRRGEMALDTLRVRCDYYDYLAGDRTVPYTGEYMEEYSWAEPTNAFLAEQAKRRSTGAQPPAP